ncbi:putative ATP-dependent RNA helicase ucp12 [Neophaeococcomyces mojaviensis]|uniref:ATP-dependent RNA helicase ucp12 n=1 Tax=Neophaeococcomyces mojaviensis TaxID=3383035 RepID=A0ACC2ZU67_9EURO|nr:putative ATP-dependent RNA helicase ucp12 [Knufia sp. JES_112]
MPPKKGAAAKSASAKNKNIFDANEGDHIVFEDDKKKGKSKGKPKEQQPPTEATGPPKPTAKQLIGGTSWTGKLPVNFLSEHCQRHKWNKPDYSMRQVPGRDGHEKLYRSEVTLSKTDPKTRETTTLPTFRTPQALIAASEEPSALEARHFAAAYALFRISSMKNMASVMPPKYRDLWKGEFQQIKKEDEKEGKGWLYDADPFAAEQKRKEIHAAMDKKKVDQEKKQEALLKNPTLALMQGGKGKAWGNAPKIEMGVKIRGDVEQMVRETAVWNPYEVKISKQDQIQISDELTKRGFRRSHVEEALRYCKDEEEVLEWLLIHVPEDDLPTFALPANYSAGISLASGDLVTEAKLKRLASAGYPRDLCAQALREVDNNEQQAALWLQSTLHSMDVDDTIDVIDSLTEWENERLVLESIYADRYSLMSSNDCSIILDTPELPAIVRIVIPTKGYPQRLPAVLIMSDKLPAYIRLSATKRVLQHAQTDFIGVPMVFSICEWLELSLEDIVNNPTSLSELHLADRPLPPRATDGQPYRQKLPSHVRPKKARIDARSDEAILSSWKERQASAQQQRMTNARKALPAWMKQDDILQAISKHQVTIISGETGSGKSTQVVQFVLDKSIQGLKGSHTNIVCTQPRRVAALSLADRVGNERCSSVGEEVGYIIRGESKVSTSTKITFLTTGVLLRRLQTSSNVQEALQGISHVFIDEVHERSLDTDFLLALLKDALGINPKLKVVLMSATLDAEIFSQYFGGRQKVAHVHIEGRTFPVTDCYLEEVLKTTKFVSSSEDEELPIGKAIQALGTGINYDLIKSLVSHIDQELGGASGAILIFLPGTLEIDRCLRAVSTIRNILAYPLHASLLPAEQRKVFPPAPAGKRKVIAATNVAETSITIEDVVAVIDTGRVKETNYDVNSNIVRLAETWASQAACKQRRGRAGRVREGTCYKLFTKHIEAQMASKPLPEILRVPLEQLCLSVKATGEDRDVSAFLAGTLTPPDQGAIANAISILHIIGALEDNRLTALGTYLSMIPADLRCAKLLVYGTLFDCLEPCLNLASILTVKDPFVSPRDRRAEADAAKATFPTAHGDLLLSLSAYEEYASVAQELRYRDLQAWCSEKFLSLNTLRDITSTRSQLLDSLKDANLVPLDYRSPRNSSQTTSPLLLRAIISAALQPQIAEIRLPDKKYMQSLTGAKELDPEARTIKYFIPAPTAASSDSISTTDLPSRQSDSSTTQRVFIHPSSPLFHSTPSTFTTGSTAATYLSYFSKMATGASQGTMGPKTYIHSLTPLNTYSLLLFGGPLRIDTEIPGGGIVIAEHFKLRGWARIGVLVSRLRRLLDEELRKAIDEPAGMRDFSRSKVVSVVKRLVELNGQDR